MKKTDRLTTVDFDWIFSVGGRKRKLTLNMRVRMKTHYQKYFSMFFLDLFFTSVLYQKSAYISNASEFKKISVTILLISQETYFYIFSKILCHSI